MNHFKTQKTKNQMFSKILNIIFGVVIIILCFLLLNTCSKKEAFEKINEANKDTLNTFRDKEGLHHAEIQVLEGSISDLMKLNSKKDSTLKKLQAIVDKNTKSATILGTKTNNHGTTSTTVTYTNHTVIEVTDTTKVFRVDTIYPTYSTTWSDRWSKGAITATKDSIHRDITFFNEFEIKETLKRDHFWQEKKSIIEVKSNNPNTETIELKTFTKGGKKARPVIVFVSGVLAGVVLTTATAIYILK